MIHLSRLRLLSLVSAVLAFCAVSFSGETTEKVRVLSARVAHALQSKPELPNRPPNININIRKSGSAGAATGEAACPEEAACLIEVKSPQRLGSGVYVKWKGYSLLLTAAHVVNDLGGDSVVLANGVEARRVLIDRKADLAVLYTGDHASIDLADSDPAVGDIVDSWGRGEDGKMACETDEVTSVYDSGGYQNQPAVETKKFPPLGRSGSGLCRNGRLVGVLHSRDNSTRTAQWSRLRTVKTLLGRVNLTGKRKAAFYSGESAYGDLWCPNCTAAKAKFGDGDDRVLIEHKKDVVPSGPGQYPAVRWPDVYGVDRYPTAVGQDGQRSYKVISSLDELVAYIDKGANDPGYVIPVKDTSTKTE